MSATLIIYERGNSYVEHPHGELKHHNGNTEPKGIARGLVGKLTAGGLSFETLERMEDYVTLAEGIYPMSSMYSMAGLGTVVNPWLGKHDKDPDKVNLLIHSAPYAFNLQGCIAPGKLKTDGTILEESPATITKIWEQCGGSKDRTKSIVVTLKVVGVMKNFRTCTKIGV